jgi:hypothetical protein
MNDDSSPPARKSRLATSSLVLGIYCMVSPITAWIANSVFDGVGVASVIATGMIGTPLALVFSIISLNRIGKSGGRITGRGQAIAGIITGTVSLLLAMILPAVESAREKDHIVQCMNNMMQIRMAISLYADAHDGNIPRQFDDLRPYATNLDKLLICPSAKDRSHPSYQITLGGGKWERWNTDPNGIDAIVVTESTNDHRIGYHVLYDDGHAQLNSNGRDPLNPN